MQTISLLEETIVVLVKTFINWCVAHMVIPQQPGGIPLVVLEVLIINVSVQHLGANNV